MNACARELMCHTALLPWAMHLAEASTIMHHAQMYTCTTSSLDLGHQTLQGKPKQTSDSSNHTACSRNVLDDIFYEIRVEVVPAIMHMLQ